MFAQIGGFLLDSYTYKNTKPLLMSNGDIPDLIYEMDPLNVQADVKQGFLAEVPYETISKYAPTVFKYLTETVSNVWLYSYCNGKNYGVPNTFYNGDKPIMGVWRLDWLEKVGINKAPETIDEMHDAFVKFVNNDPDGNGLKDTYGMTGNMTYTHITFNEIFGAYGALPFNWIEKDGEISYGGLQPEVIDALKTLSQWYAEGLIDPDFITDDVDKNFKNKIQSGRIGYVNSFGHLVDTYDEANPNSIISVTKSISPSAKLVPSVALKGPNGQNGGFAWGKGGHIIAFGKHLEKQPEKLQRILEMLEYMFANQDFLIQTMIGEEGVHYNLDENKGGVSFVAPYDNVDRRKEVFGVASIGSTAFFGIMPVLAETAFEFMSNYEKELFEKRQELNGMIDVFLKPDVVPESEKYFQDIKTKQLILMSEIIRGDKAPSQYAEFETYFNKLGGAELFEQARLLQEVTKSIKTQCEKLLP